jgi:hypothetical protein
MPKIKTVLLSLLILAVAALTVAAASDPLPAKIKLSDDLQLSGPYQCENLSVFLIHGREKIAGKKIMPLAEALAKGLVTVHETGDVNRLSARNHSDDHYIFIQSGDIVKGGRQDRTLGQDMLLPPKSGKIALDSFCVEQGRWSQRGHEQAGTFSGSTKQLSGKELKLAAKQARSQGEVWKAVADTQERLSQKVGKSVRSDASATSLQLSLEDKAVEEKSAQYLKAMLPVGRAAEDAVGFAYAIDGQMAAADLYGSPELFRKLYPKLIDAATHEAIAAAGQGQVRAVPDAASLKEQILAALNAPKRAAGGDGHTRRTYSESKERHTFETRDEKDQMIHLNVIQK